jgi:hypothetical protein
MRNQLITLAACLSVFSFTACKNTQKAATTPSSTTAPSTAEELVTTMSVPEKVKVGSPIMLKFTVSNNSGKELQFCKWHTPFEKFMNSYFDIQDSKGEPVMYKGIMAKRIMPPPAEAYIKVRAKDKVSSEIDLLTGYRITAPGTYKLTYQDSGMSGLTKVNEVTFTVTE